MSKYLFKLAYSVYRTKISQGYGHYASICCVELTFGSKYGKALDRLFGWM